MIEKINIKIIHMIINQKTEINLVSWNKPQKNGLAISLQNLSPSDSEEAITPSNGDKNLKRSTLSLHIFAYENSIENHNGEDDTKNMKRKPKSGNIWKDFKQLFTDSPTNQLDLSEIPRQQRNDDSKAEIMRFTLSQRLLNPNEINLKIQFGSLIQRRHTVNTPPSEENVAKK
uniref:Uncharacterized protein n=1 Tax=Panagrolaimus superbus TaxID=310955 RepID=A0A914XPR7_9BILA